MLACQSFGRKRKPVSVARCNCCLRCPLESKKQAKSVAIPMALDLAAAFGLEMCKRGLTLRGAHGFQRVKLAQHQHDGTFNALQVRRAHPAQRLL